jgi:pimeloyl-ACP methyl ester carboxylesterase
MRLLWRILIVAAALYAGLCVLVFLLQRRLLYFPDRYPENAVHARAAKLGLTPWPGAGAPCGWRAGPEGRAVARLLVLHGNGGSALDRTEYPAALVPLPLWLLGESLGSGVAARAVTLRPAAVQGLVLVTPFARLTDVVRLHYPFLPSVLLRDRFDPATELAVFRGPTAVIVAGRDEVVSAAQGRLLFDALLGSKRLYLQDDATHNTVALAPGLPMWEDLVAFLLRAGL